MYPGTEVEKHCARQYPYPVINMFFSLCFLFAASVYARQLFLSSLLTAGQTHLPEFCLNGAVFLPAVEEALGQRLEMKYDSEQSAGFLQ